MNPLVDFIFSIFNFCKHEWGWPLRRVDDNDWQVCSRCGRGRISPIQFGKVTHRDAV